MIRVIADKARLERMRDQARLDFQFAIHALAAAYRAERRARRAGDGDRADAWLDLVEQNRGDAHLARERYSTATLALAGMGN